MSLDRIQHELQRRIGLNPDSVGLPAIHQVVQTNMIREAIADEKTYVEKLIDSSDSFQQLVNELVVPETWFLRGKELFDWLGPFVRAEIERRPVGVPFRILSVGCSTGEEPYSIAMILHRQGVKPHECKIIGVDLSPKHIEIARQGRYKDFSFRQFPNELQEMYFRKEGDNWEIASSLRTWVQFRIGNVVDAFFLRDEAPFDLILCRNVFIYFHPAARKQALDNLLWLLKPEGLLGTGHAESIDLEDRRWKRHKLENLFLYSRVDETVLPKANPVLAQPVTSALVPQNSLPNRSFPLPTLATTSVTFTPPNGTGLSNCWNIVGVWGDHSCVELPKHVHCHNCPVFAKAGRQFLDAPAPAGYQEEWTQRLAMPLEATSTDHQTVLIFRLGEEWLALAMNLLVEVTVPRVIHRIPHRGGLLAGMVNIRGELYLCMKIAPLLGIPEEVPDRTASTAIGKDPRFLVVCRQSDRWVFPVAEVDRVHQLPKDALTTIPATVGRAQVRYTKSLFTWQGRTVGFLDEVRLFEALRAKLR